MSYKPTRSLRITIHRIPTSYVIYTDTACICINQNIIIINNIIIEVGEYIRTGVKHDDPYHAQ